MPLSNRFRAIPFVCTVFIPTVARGLRFPSVTPSNRLPSLSSAFSTAAAPFRPSTPRLLISSSAPRPLPPKEGRRKTANDTPMESDDSPMLSLISSELRKLGSKAYAAKLLRFFQTSAGSYGEGDQFLGIRVPDIRSISKRFRAVPYDVVTQLLSSPLHEERLLALLFVVDRFAAAGKAQDPQLQRDVVQFYVRSLPAVNNWDLVDVSCHHVVGAWVAGHHPSRRWLLYHLAHVPPPPDVAAPDAGHDAYIEAPVLDAESLAHSLWSPRVAIVSTLALIREGLLDDTLLLAEGLAGHDHHLIHKAVGWTVREAMKRDKRRVLAWLVLWAPRLARVTLSYATEKLTPTEKKRVMRSAAADPPATTLTSSVRDASGPAEPTVPQSRQRRRDANTSESGGATAPRKRSKQ
mmetsp:Transcript_17846/g.30774  ORF Transcript_17846/g.30774 Transcript_17846/m.30774 type:complete len:407 (+) Transcript_17846:96-1316(+)